MADSAATGVPLDLVHLRRQTGGDAALEREVLSLFLAKARTDIDRITNPGSAQERREAAHALVGSARAIGAVEVARLAATVERETGVQSAAIAPLKDALRAAEGFIHRHLRG
jgi:HPt (histidine-containing phosphotransfer) domain-containing protein